jgi:hypothetical protein
MPRGGAVRVAQRVWQRVPMAERKSRQDSAGPGVRTEWGRRVWAETNSAGVAAQLFSALVELQAPHALLTANQRIVEDELRHAADSQRVFGAAGGTPRSLEALRMPAGPAVPADWDALQRAVGVCCGAFCCGETVAVPLFLGMFRRARHPDAQQVLRGILRDEGRHRAFGWTTLRWLKGRLRTRTLQAWARQRARDAVMDVVAAYSGGTWEPNGDESRWGVMGGGDYRRVVRKTAATVMVPRFRALGLWVGPFSADGADSPKPSAGR